MKVEIVVDVFESFGSPGGYDVRVCNATGSRPVDPPFPHGHVGRFLVVAEVPTPKERILVVEGEVREVSAP